MFNTSCWHWCPFESRRRRQGQGKIAVLSHLSCVIFLEDIDKHDSSCPFCRGGSIYFFLQGRLIFSEKEMTNFGLFQEGCVAELPQAAWSPLAQPHGSPLHQCTTSHFTHNECSCWTTSHVSATHIECNNCNCLHSLDSPYYSWLHHITMSFRY